MKNGTPRTIRNVVLASYPGAGKTSLTEALAFSTGIIPTMGSVLQGNTIGDFEPEEVHRHHSLSSALLQFEWQGTRINILDTPGMVDYGVEVQSSLRAADGVILVIGAGTGLRSEIERVWEYIQDNDLPCLLYINELDKAGTDFNAILGECEKTLELKGVPLTIPASQDGQLTGIIDLLSRQLVTSNTQSSKTQRADIPADHEASSTEHRRRLTELVAETNDQLVEKYLTDGELSDEDLIDGLTMGTLERKIVPVLCGSATEHVGMTSLLEAIVRFLPSPEDRANLHPLVGTQPQTHEECQQQPDAQAPFSGLAFKTTIDPFMGRLTYVRIMSGTLQADSPFFNASRQTKEKGGHLFFSVGKKHQQIDQACAGDIVAIAKLKDTQTGDTICDDKHPIVYPGLKIMKPVMSYALEVKSKNEIDKVSLGLHKLVEEDPSLEFLRNDETKEMLLSGVGQVHIDATLEKLRRKYGVDVNLHMPKVPYKETIQGMAQAQGKYKKQTGGHGQFGDCWLQIEPLPRGQGFEFHNKIVGGAIPRNFIPAVEKGVVEAMQHGIIAGFPVVDIQVTVYDGSHHPVDSSEMAFKVAASMGFKKAMESAQAGLLEPVMAVEVTVPDDLVGAVIGDLNSRRGRIQGMDVKGHNEIVKAHVPLAEILTYAPTLTSLTAGKGSYRMEFFGYEDVPKEMINRIVEEHKKEAVASTS
ncbi:MAG: elongation factor G [Nitrospirota bacterium]|jgi:elongation factor G|nr:elongation factor G [Nitrospirota bacterium]MDX2419964.1 elongation factor G [Nitrospirota bacterium]